MSVSYTPPVSATPFFVSDKFANFIVGPIGCVAGDTLILTERGPVPIADITRPVRVLSWNEKTRRYQLSQASVAFPKGTDYLYRVATPQGEFVAAGAHLVLLADGTYRRVEALQAGDVLKTCSDTQQVTSSGFSQPVSHASVRRYSQTDEDYQDGYGVSDRLHGLLLRCLEAGVLNVAPSHSGAQTCTLTCGPYDVLQRDSRGERLFERTLSSLFDVQQQTDGCYPHDAPHSQVVAGRTSEEFSEYGAGSCRATWLSQQKSACRRRVSSLVRRVQGLVSAWCSPKLSSTDRPIMSVERLGVKQTYWDIQVNGTHNYVTIDGAIHHNSTKTTASIMKIAYEARRVKACKDGIRRSRCAVIRNTRQMLWDTTIPDFLKWFPDGAAGGLMKTESKFLLKFDDVECEVLFRGLDDANDVRRLLSLQLTFGVMDEFREINPDVYNALTGRLGRYPDKTMNGVGACDDEGKQIHKVWGATNPPDADTFWETLLSEPPENVHVTFQPSGTSEEADWVQYLPDGYYDNLCEGKTEDWIDVYVHGKFGKSLAGTPVYKSSFIEDFHVAKDALRPNPLSDNPIIIGIDFGRTPCAVFKQRDAAGRVLTLAELTSEDMGIETFTRTLLVPYIANHYQGYEIICAPDPAGFMKQQLNEITLVDVLKTAGLRCIKPPSNKPEYRIQSVERLLAQQIEGRAMYLIDPSCSMLIRGFKHGYRYKKKRDGSIEDKPDKNEFSHIHDANQYADSLLDTQFRGSIHSSARREVRKASYFYA